MRNTPFWIIVISLMILLDFYVFQAVKVVTANTASRTRLVIHIIYWVISGLALLTFILLPFLNIQNSSKGIRTTVFAIVAGLFFAKFAAVVVFLIDDLRRGLQWIAAKLFFSNEQGEGMQDNGGISRSVFLSWLGLAAGTTIFGTLLNGFSNKYDYRVRNVRIPFANLPAAFKGLKIVQISDVHSGSFNNPEAVQKGIKKILEQKPDLILFTGDLVNNTADEMKNYVSIFSQLKAPMGVYSTLGNHDYGDYVQWKTPQEKIENLNRLKAIHAQMGWKLMMNEHQVFERNGEKIALLGIENWGAKARFPKYGKMKEAYEGTGDIPFKILMSHDPSHWDAEVRPKYSDIDLTLSGHTHGMQFGVDLPWFKWSPVQYVYKQWAGLYQKDNQSLYVNRGFGFIGYPGRVGIMPEISVLELV